MEIWSKAMSLTFENLKKQIRSLDAADRDRLVRALATELAGQAKEASKKPSQDETGRQPQKSKPKSDSE